MFEKATKLKLRYETPKGFINTEDLWDLPLMSQKGISLDGVAKFIYRELKQSEEESFVVKKTTTSSVLELKFSIVKHIIAIRLEENESRKKRTENKVKKEKILTILAEQEDDTLKKTDPAELRKMLEDL